MTLTVARPKGYTVKRGYLLGKTKRTRSERAYSVQSLQDQFDKPISVTEQTTTLIFSRDMDGGEVVQAAFAEAPKDQWPQNLVYIADISGMPSLIAKFIAVPKMKDYPFILGLDNEGVATANLPASKEQATIIKLNQLEVISIEQVDEPKLLIEKW